MPIKLLEVRPLGPNSRLGGEHVDVQHGPLAAWEH